MLNLDELIKTAMKERNEAATLVYREIKTMKMKLETAKNAKPYTEATEISILQKMAKTREESIAIYKQANREDLYKKEEDELAVIKSLLPASVSREDIDDFYKVWRYNVMSQLEFPNISKKEMGLAIKEIKAKFPSADGKLVSEIVKSYIKD